MIRDQYSIDCDYDYHDGYGYVYRDYHVGYGYEYCDDIDTWDYCDNDDGCNSNYIKAVSTITTSKLMTEFTNIKVELYRSQLIVMIKPSIDQKFEAYLIDILINIDSLYLTAKDYNELIEKTIHYYHS